MEERHLKLAPSPESLEAPDLSEHPINVVVADDHSLMRRALALLLEDEDDLTVIAQTGDLASLIADVDRCCPHVLVLDLGLTERTSSKTIAWLCERDPQLRIVVVTMEENPVFAQRALAAGAHGFVLKDRADEELPQAIRLATCGERYVSPRLAVSLQELDGALREDGLSVREVEVLRLLALGHTNVEIAAKLALSPRTVETHRARIQRKLGLATRAELVSYALRRGLLKA
jgi:two-component system response regulator NreC